MINTFSKVLKLFNFDNNSRYLSKIYKIANIIEKLEPEYEKLSDEELRDQTTLFRKRLSNGEVLNDILPEAFAVAREATKRVCGKRLFFVQLVGGIVMHHGKIAEMKTGEGKTLVSLLPAYLNALSGDGVHIVTINDYLAKRDAKSNGEIYNFLGLTTGCILSNMNDDDKACAYAADITYGTNNEFGFDHLRRHLRYSKKDIMREYNMAIVDEIDSILIDEGRTPLIISGNINKSSLQYETINRMSKYFKDEHLEIDEQAGNIHLTDKGHELAEELFRKNDKILMKGDSLYNPQNGELFRILSVVLKAHKIYKKDVDYMIHDGKVKIIDEFTGRILEGRRYSDGLHQAIEAKEGIKIQDETHTLATITFQNYFRLYKKLTGMTGTASTESTEFREIYGLDVVSVPTNLPVCRKDDEDIIYSTMKQKYSAILDAVQDAYDRGQPVLIGTASVEKSEYLSQLLRQKKIPHNVLNAKYHEAEADIIAKAGHIRAVTIATNMAGRGTDIMLGGNVEQIAREIYNERIKIRDAKERGAKTQKDQLELKDGENNGEIACKSGENEALYKEIYSQVREEVKANRQKVLESGGLLVIGSERNEARRIDDQLRGRSGRQGDVGKSVFYLSLEDDLMRVFGSQKIQSLLTKLGLKEDEAIIHPWVTRAITKAQQKVEQRNFEIRKNLLLYDDVLNQQRDAIYAKREIALNNPELLRDEIEYLSIDWIKKIIKMNIDDYHEVDGIAKSRNAINAIFGFSISIDQNGNYATIDEMLNYYEEALRAIIKDADENLGDEFAEILKHAFLMSIDNLWQDHVQQLEYLRTGIGLHAYANKNPLNEYREEAFRMFKSMLESLENRFLQNVFLIINHRKDSYSDNCNDNYIDDLEKNQSNNIGGNAINKDDAVKNIEINGDSKNNIDEGGNSISDMQKIMNRKKNKFIDENQLDDNMDSELANIEILNMLHEIKSNGGGDDGENNISEEDMARYARLLPRNALCPCNSQKKVKYCHGRYEVNSK